MRARGRVQTTKLATRAASFSNRHAGTAKLRAHCATRRMTSTRTHVRAASIDEGISEPVKINGRDSSRSPAFMNVDAELEVLERGASAEPPATRSDRLRSRWSNSFWDELELNAIEPWMMCNDEPTPDGLLRSDSLLSPAWRMMLLSDGSVTRHLKLLTGRADVKTDVLWQGKIDLDHRGAREIGVPDDVHKRLLAASSGTLLQREVDLCDAHGDPLCYAASWWNTNTSDTIVLDTDADNAYGALDRPVWLKLAEDKTELFREVRRVYRGQSERLSSAWGLPTDTYFWGRHYIFWLARKPLCVIHEVMSPALETYLGPAAPAPRARRARSRRT